VERIISTPGRFERMLSNTSAVVAESVAPSGFLLTTGPCTTTVISLLDIIPDRSEFAGAIQTKLVDSLEGHKLNGFKPV
jgi:hypothetical protein